MSRVRAGWLLWVAALLLIPLPYFIIAEGSVPVVRFAMLGAIAAAYAGFVDGSGVAWPMTIILFVHVIPNSLGPIIVLGTLGMGSAILDVAGLNFLGLGGDPFRIPEWGLILTQGWDKRPDANLQVAVAGLAIFITVLGFNLLGDGLKDELDPRTRRR